MVLFARTVKAPSNQLPHNRITVHSEDAGGTTDVPSDLVKHLHHVLTLELLTRVLQWQSRFFGEPGEGSSRHSGL
jgi:hypothetical protein